jgi:hypothetical protein
MYWHSQKPPALVVHNLEKLRELHPEWDICMFDQSRAERELAGFPKDIAKNLSVTGISDWVRVALIAKFGGVWMDATILLRKPLNQLKLFDFNLPKLQGFSTPGHTCLDGDSCNIMENWMFCAPKAHPLVLAWKAEYERALYMGVSKYCFEVAGPHIKCHHLMKALPYLTQHASMVKILATRSDKDLERPVLKKSEGYSSAPFHLLNEHNYFSLSLVAGLAWKKNPGFDVVKLRGTDRFFSQILINTGLYSNEGDLKKMTGLTGGRDPDTLAAILIFIILFLICFFAGIAALITTLSTHSS